MKSLVVYYSKKGENYSAGNIKEGNAEHIAKVIAEGEATNQRIRLLLNELINPEYEIEKVRPFSPSQQELLKIYEDGVFNSNIEIPDDIRDIQKRFTAVKDQPTAAEIKRYKLWLDQKYISPYTGKPIPLAKLFTPAYEIEHVIPQSLWFDDSMSNKVICEAEVNRMKGKELGHEFIANHHGEKVHLTLGGDVEILSLEAYERHVKTTFASKKKRQLTRMNLYGKLGYYIPDYKGQGYSMKKSPMKTEIIVYLKHQLTLLAEKAGVYMALYGNKKLRR